MLYLKLVKVIIFIKIHNLTHIFKYELDINFDYYAINYENIIF